MQGLPAAIGDWDNGWIVGSKLGREDRHDSFGNETKSKKEAQHIFFSAKELRMSVWWRVLGPEEKENGWSSISVSSTLEGLVFGLPMLPAGAGC